MGFIRNPVPAGARILVHKVRPKLQRGESGLTVGTESELDKMQAQMGVIDLAGPESKYQDKVGHVVVFNRGAGLDITHILFTNDHLVYLTLNDHDVILTAEVTELQLPDKSLVPVT